MQEQNAEAGDHIVRARGAWFGNRSISAEVDLEIGTYEVLPKIEASRDADAPDVHEVVTKLAERNPQKLRQIGLNYDIANAKGFAELTDEEKKKQDQKKKEAADKKKKRAEEEAKEKAAFEEWKKEEKAEYEAWKKQKSLPDAKETSKDKISTAEPKEDEAKKESTPATTKAVENKEETTSPSAVVEEKPQVKDELVKDGADEQDTESKATTKDNANNDQVEVQNAPDASRPMYGSHPESVYGDAPPPPPVLKSGSSSDNTPKPWNAVCVLGLRVYSQDPEVNIKLIKPKDVEEGAILDVDGSTQAGATM